MCATEPPGIPAKPDESPSPSNPAAVDGHSLLSGFRRSQRIALETSVDVHIGGENEQAVVEHTKTLNVSAHGALLVLTTPVKPGQWVRLRSPQTKKEIECLVHRIVSPYAGGEGQISVQFAVVTPDFWGIASPPADWDPAWVPPPQHLSLELPLEEPPPPPELQKLAAASLLSELVKEITQDLAKPIEGGTGAAKPKGSRVFKWLILPVAAAALFTLSIATRKSGHAGSAANENSSLTSVSVEDAGKIPGLERLRLATEQDFDADAVSWLRSSDQLVSGRIPGLYFGAFESNAYILVGKANERRVVILATGELHYNAEYPVIAIAARVPKELIQKISWADPSPPDSDRDGLLIVRAADSPASAVVVFLRGNQVVSANPTDYRQIPFSQLH